MRTPLGRVSRRGRVTVIVLVIVFLLFTLFDRVVEAWTDWLWFSEVHYTQVFSGVLVTRLVLFALFGLGMALVVGANLYLAYRLRPLLRPHSAEQHTLERYRMLLVPHFGAWVGAAAGLIGLFAGLSAQSHWQDWLLFANSEPFGVKDPQFGVDVGFYVFEYPFWRFLLGAAFTAVVISVLGALAVHYLFGGVRLQGAGERMSPAARAHLTALVAAFVVLKAVAYYLDRRGLLLGHNESVDVYGAGYTDINSLLPAKEILAWISIVVAVAILVFSNAFMRNLVWPGVAIGLLVISAVAIGGIYPAAVQSFTVRPSPLSKESRYIQRSIDATRQAYGLADVKTIAYPGTTKAPPPDLAAEKETVPNIRLLDPAVVSDTYTQLQQVRGFYDFGEKLDIDRYNLDGHLQDYVVGVREINYSKLSAQQSNWQNRHTIYTHGYGFVAAPANKLVCGGQPYFVSGFLAVRKDQPPPTGATGESCSSDTDLILANQPRIYYGERMTENEYAIVGKPGGGKDAEFDRPTGAADEYFTYNGSGGVPIGSYGRRLLYALKYKETNFLLSSVFNDNSRLLYVRDPTERVKKVAPFLKIDGDPYPAVVNGQVLWIIDGYTTSSTYPYAQRVNLHDATSDSLTNVGTIAQVREEINYMRNSVKATVDAYTGAVTLYAFDEADPVLKVWNKAFGGNLFKPRSAIPQALIDHLRYPEDQFKVQRDLLAKFHVTDPSGFFSQQDFWEVPIDPAREKDGLKQPPYYLVARFPGEDATMFQLTAAAVPRKRQNLASLISAYYDNGGHPKISVLELPDDTAISGPIQVFAKMTSFPDVRRDLSLFTQSGKVLHGNLLSLPIGGGMLYIEPLYIQSNTENSYPLMKKVLLSYGEFVGYADDLKQGLDQLVQASGKQPPPGGNQPPSGNQPPNTGTGGQPSGALAAATARLQQAISNLRAAQQSGDFEAYGKALKELDDAIKAWEEANRQSSSTPSPGPQATPSGSPVPKPSG
jgi:uncharacterized membrane protein (UPF0182 family)